MLGAGMQGWGCPTLQCDNGLRTARWPFSFQVDWLAGLRSLLYWLLSWSVLMLSSVVSVVGLGNCLSFFLSAFLYVFMSYRPPRGGWKSGSLPPRSIAHICQNYCVELGSRACPHPADCVTSCFYAMQLCSREQDLIHKDTQSTLPHILGPRYQTWKPRRSRGHSSLPWWWDMTVRGPREGLRAASVESS